MPIYDLFLDLPPELPADPRKALLTATTNPGPRPKDHMRLLVQIEWPPAVGTPAAARLNTNRLTHTLDPNQVTVSDADAQAEERSTIPPAKPEPVANKRGRPRKQAVTVVAGVAKPLPRKKVDVVKTVPVAAHTGAVAPQTITTEHGKQATLSTAQINKAFGGTGTPGRVIKRDAMGNIVG